MLQQINLYKLLPIKSRFQLTQPVIFSIYSIFILVLIFIYGVELREKQHVMAQYTVLTKQVNALQQHLAFLTQQYPVTDAISLKKTVQELQRQLSSKVNMLNLLTNKDDFSAYLSGLANVDVQGIWLAEILFNKVDRKINLKGFALQAELVEKILAQLGAQPVFSTFKFEVQNVTETALPVSFEISAKQEVLP